MLSKCKLCGEPIWMGKLASGGLAILDAEPAVTVPNIEYVIVEGTAFTVDYYPLRSMIDLPVYACHAETCTVWNRDKGKPK